MMICVNAYHHVSLKILKFALYGIITSIIPMLIPDLLNTLFDQSDYDTLTILRSLCKRKTEYANKYSLLCNYEVLIYKSSRKPRSGASVLGFIKSICKLGPIKTIKHIVEHINNSGEVLYWHEQSSYIWGFREKFYANGCCASHHECNGNCRLHFREIDCALHRNICDRYCGCHLRLSASELVLSFCVVNGHLEAVKYLVSIGTDIRLRNDRALKLSAESGYVDIFKYLDSLGANLDVLYDVPMHTMIINHFHELRDKHRHTCSHK